MRIILLFILLFPLMLLAGGKLNSIEKSVYALKLKDLNISLDGKLNESIWQSKPISGFTQRDPVEGKPASENTSVWVAYDNNYLYVAAKLNDSKPEYIDASLARRDASIESDWFSFFVDPYNDKKSGYFFAVNAGGTMSDGVFFNDSWDDNTWDGIWEAKTSIDKEGWCVEMRIPFSQLRFKEADEMTWGVNFARDLKRNKEYAYYIMVPKKESGFVSHFAPLEGLNGIKPKQRFEVLPYLVQKAQYLKHDANDPFYKSNQYKTTLGADLKLGIGTNMNLDITINPDFGQVEVDPAVINLSASESYFNEKRPFFIEGANLFMFGIGGANNNWGFNFGWPELFYSRRIGRSPQGYANSPDYENRPSETRILGAAKLNGKLNESTSVVALSAFTERTFTTAYNYGNQSEFEIEPFTHYGVARSKTEFNEGNQSLGFMFTTVNRDLESSPLKSSLSKNAYVFGTDGYTFLDADKEYVLTGAFSASYTHGSKEAMQRLQKQSYRYFQRPDATYMKYDPERTSLAGYFGRVMLNKQKGNFYLNAAFGMISPGFEDNDLGFQFMADRINGHLVLGYRWFEPDGIFRRKQVYVSTARSFDFEGNNLSTLYWLNSNFTLENYWGFGIGATYNPETLNKTSTRGGPIISNPSEYSFNVRFFSDQREKLSIMPSLFFAEDKLGGTYFSSNFSVEWRPNPRITLSIGPGYEANIDNRQWVGKFSDELAVNTYGTRYVFASINQKTVSADIRLNWTFSPTISLQLFMQPFIAVGSYSNFKEVAKIRSLDLNNYGQGGSTITENNGIYTVDPDGAGSTKSFSFSNPNFNYKSLRGTAVLRWEVMPGSIFYFVWSHNQANYDDPGSLNIARDFKNLWSSQGDDVLMVKFSYWLDI